MNGLSDVDFRDYYENKHAPLASSLLTLEGYERNYVNSKLNPLYSSLGSISIFQYQSMQSLEVVGKEMSSSAGDKLRNDELEFMDVSKNYHVLTESDQLTKKEFKKKIFYPLKNCFSQLSTTNIRKCYRSVKHFLFFLLSFLYSFYSTQNQDNLYP